MQDPTLLNLHHLCATVARKAFAFGACFVKVQSTLFEWSIQHRKIGADAIPCATQVLWQEACNTTPC